MKERKYRNKFWRIFHFFFGATRKVLNLVATFLLIGVYLSLIVSPERVSFLAYFGLSFPFIIGFIVLLLIYNLVARHLRSALYVVVLLFLAFPQIRIYFPLHSKSEIPQESIKVVSFNVMGFGYFPHTSRNPNPTLVYLKQTQADIICLQEAMLTKEKNQWLSLRKIKSYFPEYPYIDYRMVQQGGSSLLLLSKYPILYARALPLSSQFNGSVCYRLDIKGKEVALINVHLESTRVKKKDSEEYFALAKNGQALELTKRISFKLAPSFALRARQVDRLALEISTTLQSTPYLILCGDFNDIPISYAHQRLTSRLEDQYVATGSGAGYSFHLKGLGLRIDHILASKAFQGYVCRVDKSIAVSDHKPISCYLAFKP